MNSIVSGFAQSGQDIMDSAWQQLLLVQAADFICLSGVFGKGYSFNTAYLTDKMFRKISQLADTDIGVRVQAGFRAGPQQGKFFPILC